MKPSTGKVKCAVKTSEIFSQKNYKVQKVPQLRESERYGFLNAFNAIYLKYLVKVAVQPRTGIDMTQNVLNIYSDLLMSKMD